MITGKDQEHVPLAHLSIESFVEQSYIAKVLIIVNDGNLSVLEGTRFSSNPCICEKIIPRKPDQKLGALRNIAVSFVPAGGVWVQWDDDDYRHRSCMAGQLAHMQSKQAGIVFLQRQIHIDLLWNSSFKYEYGEWGLWGTLMANSSVPAVRDLRLPNLDRGEDNYYDTLRAVVNSSVWSNEPRMYFRVIHGRNTWDRAHFKPEIRFRRNTWCIRMEDICTRDAVRDTAAMFALYYKVSAWTTPESVTKAASRL